MRHAPIFDQKALRWKDPVTHLFVRGPGRYRWLWQGLLLVAGAVLAGLIMAWLSACLFDHGLRWLLWAASALHQLPRFK